jgi:lipoprotein-releasing system ATP-binding protein
MNDTDQLLSARDLRKKYKLGRRTVEVLAGVSLDVQRGSFLALRGASGAGKSTLLHLLGGLDTPDSGEIVVSGENLRQVSSSSLCKFRNKTIGFIFQAYHLLPEFDALENVCMPARMSRHPRNEIARRGKQLLERVGLGARLDHRPYELSGGEQQRVAIARALINEPELILADEPTGNLDSHTGEEILNLLCEIREERKATLLIATHDAKVAERAPRLIQLVDGQIQNSSRYL